MPANCSEEEETRQRTKARATGMVVLREGASREEREAAELEAHRAWEQSGRTAHGWHLALWGRGGDNRDDYRDFPR